MDALIQSLVQANFAPERIAPQASMAQYTTLRIGGPAEVMVNIHSADEIAVALRAAKQADAPVTIIGNGSNLLVRDGGIRGLVLRISGGLNAIRREGDCLLVQAGASLAAVAAFARDEGLSGMAELGGIPGTVGASVVQNIGAYGQEVATSVDSVEVWDRKERAVKALRNDQLAFGYRMSALKASMYSAPATPAAEFFPTPRYVVLSVTFALRHSDTGVVGYGQLAKALDVAVGDRMNTADIRNAVLKVRAAKGMLEDAHRYASPAMQGTKKTNLVDVALESQSKQNGDDGPDFNRHSCGSFFMNPILTPQQAETLPEDAPRFDAALPGGGQGVKTSAAWLIDHAGCHKGYKVDADAPASLSTQHTLALTNRGGASAADIAALARAVQQAVKSAFGVDLVPEPVCVGVL